MDLFNIECVQMYANQPLFLKIFIGAQLSYNVVLVLGVQQSESVIHISTLFFRFFSHIDHYRVLSRVPCAIQQVLISYLFYIQQCVYVNPNLTVYPSPPNQLFSMLFLKQAFLTIFAIIENDFEQCTQYFEGFLYILLRSEEHTS